MRECSDAFPSGDSMSIPYAPLSNHCLPQHEACAWHSPTAPTIVMTAQGPKVLLWIKAQPWPQEVLLRCEPDNEEWLLQMTLQTESAGWRGYCADLPLHQASSRHFYCFKLLWRHAQCWFGPEGWSLQPPERLRQFCLALPDPHPNWVPDQIFYQIFPDRFAPGRGDHLVQEGEYQHHARNRRVRRRAWDQPLELEAASTTFYGGDLEPSPANSITCNSWGSRPFISIPYSPPPQSTSTTPKITSMWIRTWGATKR